MRGVQFHGRFLLLASCFFILTACASTHPRSSSMSAQTTKPKPVVVSYESRLPSTISNKEKLIMIDPNRHVWGAYRDGKLVKAGLATAGNRWCPDIKRACKTKAGSFRIQSLGARSCKSSIYPLPRGGAPMPYCMFFNGHQGLHGSYNVVEGNVSHGCVRVRVSDAEWIRFNFATVGTKVIVKGY
jgi:lipoprotein-anchoring transpeptidase ErfK/SrfK